MQNPILKNKFYLYMTEFFAGVSVMAVELGASRLLAPYFSSSQIVWTIIIGTIMIALALGNIYGGRSADKNPDPDKLYKRLIIAALWTAAIPVVGKYIILLVSGALVLTINTNFLIIAAFVSCIVIFAYPLFLMGTVTPCLVKYTMGSMDESGKIVGEMEAFNTIGSIIGTFLPTFVTIPTVGTAVTFLIFSGVLLCLGIIYFITAKRHKLLLVISAVFFILCAIFGSSGSFAFWDTTLIHESESIYNYLQVKEDDDSVILSTNVLFGVQSVMMKEDGLTGMYYDTALAAPVMVGKDDPDILILGMGTGTYAKQCRTYFPGSSVEGVEIDEQISDLASEYFSMPDDVSVTTYDGRAYLGAIDKKYDVIMVDAYQDITIPFQMSSVEFFGMVRDHLNPGGVMIVNMNMHSDGEGSINQYLADTIDSVFDDVYTADVPRNTNRELFAGSGDLSAQLLENIKSIENEELRLEMEEVSERLVKYSGGDCILTDDKAPVEVLGSRMIDSLITEQLSYYKGVFKEQGISGALEMLS